nr:hypothetical protein [Amylibacter cionae]
MKPTFLCACMVSLPPLDLDWIIAVRHNPPHIMGRFPRFCERQEGIGAKPHLALPTEQRKPEGPSCLPSFLLNNHKPCPSQCLPGGKNFNCATVKKLDFAIRVPPKYLQTQMVLPGNFRTALRRYRTLIKARFTSQSACESA